MKLLMLYSVIVLFVHSMAQETPRVYVQVSWDMSWKRLCNFLDFFSKQLSEQLFEKKGKFPLQIKPVRVRFMNSESHCQGSGNWEDAILDFFVSKSEKDLGSNDVHRNLTIDAYKLLYDYWKNQKMVLLDVFFIGKVNKVKLMGKEKPDIPEYMSESTKISIAVAIGLGVVFLVTATYTYMKYRKSKKPLQGVNLPNSPPLQVIRTEPHEHSLSIAPPAYDYHEGYEYNRQGWFNRKSEPQTPGAKCNGFTAPQLLDGEESSGSPML